MESIRAKQNNEALYKAAILLKDLNEHVKKLIEDPKWLEAIKAIARLERSRNIVLSAIEKNSAL